MPSVIYSLWAFRLWAKSDYGINVLHTNTINQYAYVSSIKDRIVGKKLNWAASGDAKAHGDSKYRNMRILAAGWTIATNTALFTGVGYRLAIGFPWWQVIPLLLLDVWNLYIVHLFILFKHPKKP